MFLKALLFSPQVIIVAFYTGNDPLETYSLATASGLWKKFVPAGNLSDHEIPSPNFPAPDDEIWPVVFADGIKTSFTPRLRHASNLDHPVVDIGYTIMARIAEGMADVASRHDVRIVFTIIPTKEYVYAEKVKSSGIEIDPDYHQLVTDEKRRIRDFSSRLEKLDGAKYADVITALQESALTAVPLYPENQNGHPVEPGYRVIATELEKAIKPYLTDLHNGFYFSRSDNGYQNLVYIEDGKFWLINNPEFVADKTPESISSKKLSSMLFSGLLTVATQ